MQRSWLFFLASVALAQGPFGGTWRIDLQKTQFSPKPIKMEISGGMYSCTSCVPKINVKADGTDQKVEGDGSFDTTSIQVIDDRTVLITRKKAGKVGAVRKDTVDSDGSLLTAQITVQPENGSQPVTVTAMYSRVAKGPSGSHAVSGAWRAKSETASDNGITFTIKSTGDGLSVSNPTGASYTAKFDGKDYPRGQAGIDSVSLKRLDANSFEESDKRGGKVVDVTRVTVSADGRSMNWVDEDKRRGTTTKLVATKQ